MKTQIEFITSMFLLIGIASAMYSGSIYEHTFDGEIINCSIINNNSNLDGLNLTWENSKVKIETELNYSPDNFTLYCWILQSHETKSIMISGGGMCVTEWKCTEWSSCLSEGIETRTCSYPPTYCEPTTGKPEELSYCDYVPFDNDSEGNAPNEELLEEEKTKNPTKEEKNSGITGAVIGNLATPKGIGIIAAAAIVIIGAVALIRIIKKKRM